MQYLAFVRYYFNCHVINKDPFFSFLICLVVSVFLSIYTVI